MDKELLKAKIINELGMFIGKKNTIIARKMIEGKVKRLLLKVRCKNV